MDTSRVSAGRAAAHAPLLSGREIRDVQIVTRPSGEFSKLGKSGTPIPVTANYFKLEKRPDMHLLQYRVDFNPDIDHMGVRKALVRAHEPTLGKYLFDGTLLYNIVRLPQPLEVFSKRVSDNSNVAITFRLVGEIQNEDTTYTTIMNIILRRCLGMLNNLTLLRRNYFDPNAQEIPMHSLSIWPGYLTTIRHYEDSFLLAGVERFIYKGLRRDTALDVMTKIQQSGGDVQAMCKAKLFSQIVMTQYNKKTYRIDDVDFQKNCKSTFHLRKEDRDITYLEFYSKRYQVQVRNPTQPLLVSRPTRRDVYRGDDQPIYLIPELCVMTGLTEEHRKNFTLMKDGTVTQVQPDKRVENLMKFRRRLAENLDIQKRELESWGLTRFSGNIVQCNDRVLPPYNLIPANVPILEGDRSRSLQRYQIKNAQDLQNWILFTPSNMFAEIWPFLQSMRNFGSNQGFNMSEPNIVQMQADRTYNYVEAIRNECSRKSYAMVFCVLRSARQGTYSAIKKVTCCELGIPSQVITGRNLKGAPGKLNSIATKVMIEVACKIGSEPWTIGVPKTKWMVIGYETYHDARQKKVVGAFVASFNETFSRYYSSVKIHQNNEEISPSFKDHLYGALKFYFRAHTALPENIIVYRDGVGAGDIARLKDTEIAALREACAEVAARAPNQAGYSPRIAFIVVSKKINTRFFRMDSRMPSNPMCGTVVDNTVKLNERYNFFLVSQKVTQGTVSPTSYNVVEDDTGITPDVHQKLAYALTHLYNWPGKLAQRIPVPIQYAHKLAYLVGNRIMQTPHECLNAFPYYI